AYQQLVDEGKLHGWQLYYVEYPGGERSQYNLVSVASASDLTAFEKLFTAIDDRGYIPSTAGKSAVPEIENSLYKSELWKIEDQMTDSTAVLPAKYLQIDYM